LLAQMALQTATIERLKAQAGRLKARLVDWWMRACPFGMRGGYNWAIAKRHTEVGAPPSFSVLQTTGGWQTLAR
jgi:hypothetical protein